MPHLVREHLFIGNIGDAAEVLQNGSNDITHILSVLSSRPISFFTEWRSGLSIPTKEIRKVYVGGAESEDVSGNGSKSSLSPDKLLYSLEYAGKDLKFVRMAVPMRDMESEDLLDYLDVCLDFIEDSRKEGSVLVHCFAGVSRREIATYKAYILIGIGLYFVKPLGFTPFFACVRCSAAIVTAYLMKSEQLSLDGDSYNRGEKIDGSKFGADPGLPAEILSSIVEASTDKEPPRTPAYRCKKCRRLVALQENVLDHVPGEGETCFEWHKRRSRNSFSRSDDEECSSIFIEPLRWMTTVEEGGLEGKLLCAHCEARLGYFNWSGIQCSCGSWITPAFQLHKSRVDISTI
ncbi:hypothetical protein DH2020_041424 [Rehmannia glutinosa]|uniref:protein-tyrosine-phosphatase n=1 Tax=Rehmannia glutinosa TaxID=99300 RepID=A0ABR0UQ46_REHGL